MTWTAALVASVSAGLILLWVYVGPMYRGFAFGRYTLSIVRPDGLQVLGTGEWYLYADRSSQQMFIPGTPAPLVFLVRVRPDPLYSKQPGPDGKPFIEIYEPTISVPIAIRLVWPCEALAASQPVLFICRRLNRRGGRGFPVATNA
jgi:hypothetical protein